MPCNKNEKNPFGIPTIYETIPKVKEIKENLFGKEKEKQKEEKIK